ncbi:unnamed protein product [Aureobasidium mustum]|uniref:Uncharacterized protein n=1 Tax=Aureobasidium mustum TaxID=2773714 RepID=A0A9N8JKU1_9PEZI|nr:unnamed protein product [Aureobasidium mustum]
MSTTNPKKESEPLNFSEISVSIDTNDISKYNHNSHNSNPMGLPQSSHRSLDPTAAFSHGIHPARGVESRLPVRCHDRSTSRYVRPMGPTRPNSALENRQSFKGHVEHTHGVDPWITGPPKWWFAVGNHPCWPGSPGHSFSLDLAALENSRLIPTRSQAPTSFLRPVRNTSELVSLTEIAARFGVERSAIQTLNASAEQPNSLKFIVLSENDNQNSGCYRRLDIYAKCNLHLLPGYELPYPDQDAGVSGTEHSNRSNVFQEFGPIDLRSRAVSPASTRVAETSSSSVILSQPTSTQSDMPLPSRQATEANDVPLVAVFSQDRPSDRAKAFHSRGWYEIEETEFFAPRSSALVKMLEQRSGGKASREDLEHEWATVRLVRQEASGDV